MSRLLVFLALLSANTAPGQSAASLAPANELVWRYLRTDMAVSVTQGWQVTQNDKSITGIRTEIVADGKVQDTLRTRFGIRLFEMRGQAGLFVNRKYIGVKLNGVNHHQDYAYVGNALPKSGQWRDIKLLREGGVNAIRAAHYPQAPAFYGACDEFGMLVTTANPGWQFFNDKDPVFEQRIYEDTHQLVRRDRNHPARLLWETALNETDNQPAEMLGNMNRIAHAEYPFPGMFTVTDAGLAKRGGLDFYYGGSYSGTINSFTREYGDGGEVDNFYSQNATTRVNHEWGEGPLLKQAAIRAHDLDDCYAAPPIRLGAALWCGIDHQLAEEYVYFSVEGPGEIISSPMSHTIPARTEFGTATVLLRAKTAPGLIHLEAYDSGLKSGEARI